jgi:hypothetical protein
VPEVKVVRTKPRIRMGRTSSPSKHAFARFRPLGRARNDCRRVDGGFIWHHASLFSTIAASASPLESQFVRPLAHWITFKERLAQLVASLVIALRSAMS